MPAADLASLTKETGSEIAPYQVIRKGGKGTVKYRLGKPTRTFIPKLLGLEISATIMTNYPLHTHNLKIPDKYQGRTFNINEHGQIIESYFGLSQEDLRFMRKDEKRFIVFNDGNVLVHDRYGNTKILENPENIVFRINEDRTTVNAMRLNNYLMQ